MDTKRTILWIVFSFSLLLLWDNWMRYNGKGSLFFPTKTQTANQTPVTGNAPPVNADVPQGAAVAPTTSPAAEPVAQPVKGERITITTDVLKAEIDTVGGELKRLELLKHRDGQDPQKNVMLFDDSASRTYLAQTGLTGNVYPNHHTLFTARPGPRSLDGGETVQLVLDAEQGGVKLTKTFTFRRDDYKIDVNHTVVNNTGAPISPSLYLRLLRDGRKPEGETRFYSTFTGLAVYTSAEKYQKLSFDDIAKNKAEYAKKADNGWIALVQHYFVSAFIAPEGAPREISVKALDNNLFAVSNVLPLGDIAPGASKTVDSHLYSGPEETARLEAAAPGLEVVKDYGRLTIVAKPIFWLMENIHKVLGNWGWTIIALTILIKLLFFPLSAASYRSMAKMKTVTPKMQSIRERFKDDPQKMNQAMMELYRTEKINPLGGCLPIVVQIPVFISLYWVLSASVEMRGAPWLGWIHDLASPDPLYILPVIMAVSMFVQTKLNPTPPDPMQAKIMMVMPIAFSVMFFFFPAGLVLYWVVNNIWSIAQQWVITKKLAGGKSS
jgi:YidC/Oxa1 family membrane protein insertase